MRPTHWGEALLCNASHWPSPYPEWRITPHILHTVNKNEVYITRILPKFGSQLMMILLSSSYHGTFFLDKWFWFCENFSFESLWSSIKIKSNFSLKIVVVFKFLHPPKCHKRETLLSGQWPNLPIQKPFIERHAFCRKRNVNKRILKHIVRCSSATNQSYIKHLILAFGYYEALKIFIWEQMQ